MDQQEVIQELAEEELLREADARRFLYSDVEELIEHGFLTHQVMVSGVQVSLRSLGPRDTRKVGARYSNRLPLDFMRWTVASSIWMVNGFEIDPSQANGPFHMYHSWLADLPNPWVQYLASISIGLQNRVARAIRLAEPFCYEGFSRGLWRMYGDEGGYDNTVYRMWVAFNKSEDLQERRESEWSQTRMLVSALSQQGGKALGRDIKKIEEREQRRRQKAIEAAVNWVIYGDEPEKKVLTVMVNGEEIEVPKIHAAETTADLEEEMRRVFSGEQDYHDYMVAEYHRGIRESIEKRRAEKQEAIVRARQRAAAQQDMGAPDLVGYTEEQLSQRRPDMTQRKGVDTVEESSMGAYLYEKYFQQQEIRPGVLDPQLRVRPNDRDPEDGRTLQEKIENRKPKLKE